MMKKSASLFILAMAASLAGCETTKSSCKASVDINQNNPSLKGECSWEFKGGRISQQIALNEVFGDYVGGVLGDGLALMQAQSFNPATFDANLVKMSSAGSGASISGSGGTLLVKLYQGTTVLASRAFAWHRLGQDIKISDPSGMNAWVHSFTSADGFTYSSTVNYDAGSANSAAIYGTHTYNGAVTFATTNSIVRPNRDAGPGFVKEQ